MFDLATVGHIAIDLIRSRVSPSGVLALGGAPTYGSLAARRLDAEVTVLSKVGEDLSDEQLALLKTNAVDLTGLRIVRNAATTSFILEYSNSERRLQLKTRAPPILLEDIPSTMRAKAIHIAPITNEVSREVINRLRTQTGILSLDPQGFVRKFDSRGNMSLSRWHDPRVLKEIDVYKSSLAEIQAVTGFRNVHSAMKKIASYGTRIVMVTRSVKGSALLLGDEFYDVPACRPRIVKDPTGAGDAFMGAALAEYTKDEEPLWCTCVGSAAASFVVEGVGPAVFGERREIYERAEDIYDEVVGRKK